MCVCLNNIAIEQSKAKIGKTWEFYQLGIVFNGIIIAFRGHSFHTHSKLENITATILMVPGGIL